MASGSSSLVPCVCWVPKGVSKEVPEKASLHGLCISYVRGISGVYVLQVELSEEELQQLIKEAQEQMRYSRRYRTAIRPLPLSLSLQLLHVCINCQESGCE